MAPKIKNMDQASALKIAREAMTEVACSGGVVVFRGRMSITPAQFGKPIRIQNSLRVDRKRETKRTHHIGRRGPA
jgi:hypothetical protein